VTEEEAKQFVAEHNIIFTVETSAKIGSNVEFAFSTIAQEVIYLIIHKLIIIYTTCVYCLLNIIYFRFIRG